MRELAITQAEVGQELIVVVEMTFDIHRPIAQA
jgi:hypothetical protein